MGSVSRETLFCTHTIVTTNDTEGADLDNTGKFSTLGTGRSLSSL